jgi:hypothetical protein
MCSFFRVDEEELRLLHPFTFLCRLFFFRSLLCLSCPFSCAASFFSPSVPAALVFSSLSFPARSFLRCRERLLPAAESERHHLAFAAACFHHRDHPRPVFAAASYWVDPVCLQPTLPHPSFNFCTSSCWRFV